MKESISDLVKEFMVLNKILYGESAFAATAFRFSLSDLRKIAIFKKSIPPPLEEFYGDNTLDADLWEEISIKSPNAIEKTISVLNNDIQYGSPPLCVSPEIKQPVLCGEKLIPFAYYNLCYYCVDCDPCLDFGGVEYQIIGISIRTGKVNVIASSLLEFLKNGLVKLKKQVKKEKKLKMNGPEPRTEATKSQLSATKGGEFLNCSSVVGFERENKLKVSDNCFGIAHESKQLGAVAVELKNQAQKLLDQNPATHPVQDACARLLNLYIKYAESPDPSNRRENLISRIARTHGRLTEDDISHFEIKLGVAFPEDLRALLLAHEFIAHGGQRPNAVGVAPDIVANCNQLNELFKDGQNSEEDWSLWPGTRVPVMGTHLIPIGWGEPMLCYDLKPGPGGVVGQLVSVDIEDSTCKVEYPSLLAFLEESIREIEVMQKCF